MELTIENHGDCSTVTEFWDCECELDYIHKYKIKYCKKCNCSRDSSPNSRLDEVVDNYPEVLNWEWIDVLGNKVDIKVQF